MIKKRTALLLMLAVSGACLIGGCKKKDKLDSSTLHTTEAETMAETPAQEKETPAITIDSENSETEESKTETKPAVPSVSTQKNTYKNNQISIEYPSVLNLGDSDKTASADALLKENALSIIKALKLDEAKDSLTVQCDVLSVSRNRLTVIYTGSVTTDGGAHPTEVFYSNTIDLQKGTSLGLDTFADPYTMAGYVLSADCRFPKAEEKLAAELMNYKNSYSLEDLTALLQTSDFPFEGNFPESFSYEYEGDIYFSIPVPHALGDYAIVMYTPDTK